MRAGSSNNDRPAVWKTTPSLTEIQITTIQSERWELHEFIDHRTAPQVELVKEYCCGPKRSVGPLEKHISWVVHTAAQIVITYLPFLSANGLEFNAVRASERAAALLFHALEKFVKRYPAHQLEIKVGEKQRYGVPGYVTTGVTFGKGKKRVEIAADVIEASRNIYRDYPSNRSNLGPIIAMGAEGSFIGFDDMFYINGRVASPRVESIHVQSDPRLPPRAFVSSLAKAAKLPIEEVKVLILCRDRNFDTDGKGTIQQLIDAGISVETRDPEQMRKRVAAEQIYRNGNLYLANNDFFPRTGLVTGMLHGILLTGRPAEGELLLTINRILGGIGMVEIVSYDSIANGVKEIKFARDKKMWSEYEKGRWRTLKASGHPSVKHRDTVWSPGLPKDMGIAVGFCRKSFWDDDIKGIRVDTERGTVTCDVSWLGASGDYKIFRITYPMRFPDRLSRLNAFAKADLRSTELLQWAEAAMQFRQFKSAIWAVKQATEKAADEVEAERCKGTQKQIVAFAALATRKDAFQALRTAIMALSGGSEILYRETPDVRRLLRKLLHTKADTYRQTGRACLDRYHQILGPGADENLRAAAKSYRAVLAHFKKGMEGLDERGHARLHRPDSRRVRFEMNQDRLERNTAEWQLKVVTFLRHIMTYQRGLPIEQNIQTVYADLADCYERLAREREIIAQKSALKYKEKMLEILDDISRTFGNMLPRDKVFLAAGSYMKESMWESALRTYARMIDPQKAFRIFSPKFDDPSMRNDFYESIYIDLYLVPVLAEYLHCRMLILRKSDSELKAILHNAKRWLKESEPIVAQWAKEGMLSSTKDGVVFVENANGSHQEKIELLDLITNYEPVEQ